MPRPLAAQFKLPRLFGVKHHHRFNAQTAVFGATERHDINACLPCHLGSRSTRGDQRIGKARTVEMARQAPLLGHFRQSRDLGGGVNRASLSHIGDRHHATLHTMHANVANPANGLRKAVRCHLAVIAGHADQLGTVGVKLWRATFIGGDMGVCMGKHRRPRLAVDR